MRYQSGQLLVNFVEHPRTYGFSELNEVRGCVRTVRGEILWSFDCLRLPWFAIPEREAQDILHYAAERGLLSAASLALAERDGNTFKVKEAA